MSILMALKAMSLVEIAKGMNTQGRGAGEGTPTTKEAQRDQQWRRVTAQIVVFWKKLYQRAESDQWCQIRRRIGHNEYRHFLKFFFYNREKKWDYG